MAGRVYLCPICNESFKTRKTANEHMQKTGHRGAVVIEEIEDKPKTQALKTKVSWQCPQCNKEFKDYKAAQNHIRDKKHSGTPKYIAKQLVSKTPAAPPKKEEPVAPAEPAPETMAFARLRPEDAEKISGSLKEGMKIHTNPDNGNAIIQYSNYTYQHLDDLLFKFNFVEIEMENSDIIFCMSLMPKSTQFGLYDMAETKHFGIGGFQDGKILVDMDNKQLVSISSMIEGLSDANKNAVALAMGVWKKVYGQTTTTQKTLPQPVRPPITTPTQKVEPKPEQTKSETQSNIQSFIDWDIMQWASEEEYYYTGGSRWSGFGGTGGRTVYGQITGGYTPPAPPEPKTYPVYGITETSVVIDRFVDGEIYS